MTKKKVPGSNRLAGSGSPYLRQHSTNPVQWYPWSREAFSRALAEDKPVFLSIGYATCHWCHVMERESFADEEVAELMNDTFVCVKVDREERPDVDQLYMTVCQLLTGSGGWPLTIVMTPDRRPFFAGTYLPRDERHGRPGMLQIVPRIRELWTSDRETVDSQAGEIADGLRLFLAPDRAADPDARVAERAWQLMEEQYDPVNGGFGSAPKFPMFSNLHFLLRRWHRTGEERALSMVKRTLLAMRAGGIYDQAGYGLHRYSTDGRWFAPHFEKMLYDQALAILTCLETFCATGDGVFRNMALEIIRYVERDLQAPGGGYYSAEDADSEGVEGLFYTWTAAELDQILDEEERRAVGEIYGVSPEGNYHSETGEPTGRNILHLARGVNGSADFPDAEPGGFSDLLERAREKLLDARSRRIRPLRDEKIMTDWNGLMTAALARAAWILDDDSHARSAARAFDRVAGGWLEGSRELYHLSYDPGDTVPAFLDDYAFLAWGALELYQATHQERYLKAALKAAGEMVELFADRENGGFYLTRPETESGTVRMKPSFDGPMPSGNAVAAACLLKLGRLTARGDLEEEAQRTFSAFASEMGANPAALTYMVSALDMAQQGTTEVVIAGDADSADTRKFLDALRRNWLPTVVTALLDTADPDSPIRGIIPFTSDMGKVSGRAAAYVCRDFACQAPTTDPGQMIRSLTSGREAFRAKD